MLKIDRNYMICNFATKFSSVIVILAFFRDHQPGMDQLSTEVPRFNYLTFLHSNVTHEPDWALRPNQ